jgi:2-polyprenyl-3-methyl-5-hydroxy-6-metoxy-1,4-benzoquinol methylase
MIASEFSTKGDLGPYVDIIKRFFGDKTVKLIDYGCSWGYNTWRFERAGFKTSGVEVSRPRCDFGRANLHIDARYTSSELNSDHDVFFSSHVFEHVPSPRDSFLEATRLLGNKGGLLIVITPNGCADFRAARPSRWHELWGRKHPNFLDEKFWRAILGSIPHAIMSRNEDGTVVAPLDSLCPELLKASQKFDLSGEELIAVAQLPKQEPF